MKTIIAIAAVALLSGCTAVSAISTSVSYYCATSADLRAVNREAVALAVAPNRIEIRCANGS